MPSLRQIAERRGEVDFPYLNQSFHIDYRTDRATKEFRADALRVNREVLKIQRRQARLLETVQAVEAADGSAEAEAEDAEAEAAIQRLLDDDATLKREIDRMVMGIVLKWDLLEDDGSMVPLTEESLWRVPAPFEGALLTAILQDSNQGEAQGATPSTSLPTPLPLKAKQATSRRPPNGSRLSKRVNTARR